MTKHMLLCSLLLSSFAVHTDETFTPVRFTWNYTVQPTDVSNMDDIKPIIAKMRTLLNEYASDTTRSNGTNLFQKFLVFVKELQEAITAGFNIFGSATTNEEPLLQIAEELISEAIVQTAALEENAAPDDSTKSIDQAATIVNAIPGISIAISCTVTEFAELETWNNAKAMLQELAQAINEKTMSPDEVVNSLVNVYNTLITIKDARLDLTATEYNAPEQA